MNIGQDCSNIIHSYIEDLHRAEHQDNFKECLDNIAVSKYDLFHFLKYGGKNIITMNSKVLRARFENMFNTLITSKCVNKDCENCMNMTTLKLSSIIRYMFIVLTNEYISDSDSDYESDSDTDYECASDFDSDSE